MMVKKINIFHHCDNHKIIIPNDAKKFKPEVTYNDCRFDIGYFNIADELIFGIEICETHAVENTNTRNNIPWIEIKAGHIIDLLDNNNKNLQNIKLCDYSTK